MIGFESDHQMSDRKLKSAPLMNEVEEFNRDDYPLKPNGTDLSSIRRLAYL
ncbi:MAG TPA: hypothetical protein V6C91_18385 [Coleofasciculaceae cyanobacterium]